MKPRNGTGSQPATGTDTSTNADSSLTVSTTPAVGEPATEVKVDDQAKTGDAATVALGASLVDDHAKHFEGFDPAIHATDKATGAPIPKKGGGWQLKRGGASPKQNASAPATGAAPAPGPKPVVVNTLEAAKAMCNMFVNCLVIIFGDHWAPQNEGEKQGLVGAVKNYFDANGATSVSPGFALFMAVCAYSMPRLQDERTMTKLDKIRSGFSRFGAWAMGKIRK